jgi:glycosyltransferase involved in cell wall biosynthesis
MEVIVVDDGSLEAGAVVGVVADSPRTRLVRQEASGPAAARNTGVRAAQGTFICLTDDDCEPSRDWAERLVEALQRGADAVGGRTVCASATPTARAAEFIARIPVAAGPAEDDVSFAPSNNLASSAAVLSGIPFDERYSAAAGEDRDWCERLLRTGRVLRYEPAAVLVHHQNPNLVSFFRQQFRYGRGAFTFRRLRDDPLPLERPRFYGRTLREGFAGGVLSGGLVCLAQFATAAGFATEWLSTVKKRRRALV